MSDAIPSESSYSRLVTQLSDSDVLDEVKERLILQTIKERFVIDDTVAIDDFHFEARDKASTKEEKLKAKPKKHGRKPKAEREQWLKEQAEKEANMPIYEKKIEDQLDVLLSDLRNESELIGFDKYFASTCFTVSLHSVK